MSATFSVYPELSQHPWSCLRTFSFPKKKLRKFEKKSKCLWNMSPFKCLSTTWLSRRSVRVQTKMISKGHKFTQNKNFAWRVGSYASALESSYLRTRCYVALPCLSFHRSNAISLSLSAYISFYFYLVFLYFIRALQSPAPVCSPTDWSWANCVVVMLTANLDWFVICQLPAVPAFAVPQWPLLNNMPKIVWPLAIVISHGMSSVHDVCQLRKQKNKSKLNIRFIYSGLCCQLQRRHRQLPRKVRTVCSVYRMHLIPNELSCCEIRFANSIGKCWKRINSIIFYTFCRQVCSYFRDPLTCIGTVATDQVSACFN